jgi:hypothetical protein
MSKGNPLTSIPITKVVRRTVPCISVILPFPLSVIARHVENMSWQLHTLSPASSPVIANLPKVGVAITSTSTRIFVFIFFPYTSPHIFIFVFVFCISVSAVNSNPFSTTHKKCFQYYTGRSKQMKKRRETKK